MVETVDLAGQILILTGPPGSGKTTTAAALTALPGSRKVHLHSDDFWHFIKFGCIPPYLPESHQQNQVVMQALAGVAQTYAQGGYFVVLDGIVGPWFLSAFRQIAAPLHYIVLQPPLGLAIQRCQERGGETLTDPGPITDLHHAFATLGMLERHAIQIGERPREAILDAVIQALESGEFLLGNIQ